MSWGAPPPGQNPYYQQAGYSQQAAPAYAGYQPQQAAAAPPHQAGYGSVPPQSSGYGAPPTQGYRPPAPAGTAPPAGYAGGGYAPPPQGGAYNQGAPPGGYGAPPPAGGYGAPPPRTQAPPAGYGALPGGQPPHGQSYGAPRTNYGPPPGISPELWNWFQAVDTDRSGKITSQELQQALVNGNWTPFNPETCRLMIGMFDKDRSGTIDIHEFSALWKYIQDWKACFDRFDTDRSGNINAQELHSAFASFGYNLSMNFCYLCVRMFDRQSSNTMNFDDFIQCCVMLKALTEKFKEKDTQQSGVVRIHYEEFLRMVLDNAMVVT